MNSSDKITSIIKKVKDQSQSLSGNERELLRDELLAFLLFSEFMTGNDRDERNAQNFSDLSAKEKDLIRKLAEKTDLLYRLMDRDPDRED